MSWNARILNARPCAFDSERVTVAYTAGLDPDAHLSRPRRSDLALNDPKLRSGLRNLCHRHRPDCDFCCCHIVSSETLATLQCPLQPRWRQAQRGMVSVQTTCPYRNDRNAARSSDVKNAGCSHAAKCPPFGRTLK